MTLLNHEGIVSDPSLLAEKFGPEYRFTWPQLALAVTAWDVRDGRDGALNATLQCFAIHGETLSPCSAPTPSNITGPRLKAEAARFFQQKFPLSEDDNVTWADLIERISAIIQWDVRQGEPFVDLSSVDTSAGTPYLIWPYLPLNEPTLWIGDERAGKSMFAQRLGLGVVSGIRVPHGHDATVTGNVLYLDWETTEQQQAVRLERVSRGVGLSESPRFIYRHCTRPIWEDYKRVAAEVARQRISLVIVDSLLWACGDPNDPAMATQTMNALRALGTTSIVIGHYAKGERQVAGRRSTFGSVVFELASRSRWEVRSDPDTVPGQIHQVLYHRKASNDEPVGKPLGILLRFGAKEHGSPVHFETQEVDSASEVAAGMPLPQKVRGLLAQEARPMTVSDIGEALGIADTTQIRVALNAMAKSNTVTRAGTVAGTGSRQPQVLWGLLERRDGDGPLVAATRVPVGRDGRLDGEVSAGMARDAINPEDLTECAACLRQMPVARYDDLGAPICVSCDAMGVENAPRRAEPVTRYAPHSKFGETRNVRVQIHVDGKTIDDGGGWEETLWVERGEDWYALGSTQLRDKRVRIIERKDWLAAEIIPVHEGPEPEEGWLD